MFKFTNRLKYQIPELLKNKNGFQINKFMKTILLFDGSMTNLVANLTEAQPKIQILYQKKVSKSEIQKIQKESCIQKGYFLNEDFSYNKLFFNNEKQSSEIIQRSIIFNINKQKCLKQNQCLKKLYYARSFWNLRAYDEIMSKNPSKPIGYNLINLKVPLFREINWVGKVDLQIDRIQSYSKRQKKQQSQEIVFIKEKQIFCRSYTMLSQNNLVLCQLQEYFLDAIVQIFK